MISGKLGSADLLANTDTLLYTTPAAVTTTANIRMVNHNAAPVKVRLAVGSGAAPSDADYIEFDTTIPASGVLENTAVVLGAGEKIWAKSDTAGVSVRVHGFEGGV